MAKCSICKSGVEETFLGKLRGTWIGKKTVCSECQKKHSMDELKEKLK